jgi:hypothetical protein
MQQGLGVLNWGIVLHNQTYAINFLKLIKKHFTNDGTINTKNIFLWAT